VVKEKSYFLPKEAGPGTLPEQVTSRGEGVALNQRAPWSRRSELFSLVPRRAVRRSCFSTLAGGV